MAKKKKNSTKSTSIFSKINNHVKVVATIFGIIGVILVGIKNIESVFIFPKKHEISNIMNAYNDLKNVLNDQNAYCSISRTSDSHMESQNNIYRNKIEKGINSLTNAGKNIYNQFSLKAHDNLACFIITTWGIVRNKNICAMNYSEDFLNNFGFELNSSLMLPINEDSALRTKYTHQEYENHILDCSFLLKKSGIQLKEIPQYIRHYFKNSRLKTTSKIDIFFTKFNLV